MVAGVSARLARLVLRKEWEKKVTEIITNDDVAQNDDSQQQAEEKLRTKFVYVDEQAKKLYLASDKNKTLPASVHPALYVAVIDHAYNNMPGTQDTEGGRPGLKPGALVDLTRVAIAQYVGYDGELAITSTRVTSAEKQQADAFNGTAATVFMFARIQAMGDPDAEAQAKRTAFAVMLKRKDKLAPNMQVTEDDLEALWAEAE